MADEGCEITTKDLKTGEVETMVLGPDGDYVVILGPKYEMHRNMFSNGTTQITIKRIPTDDGLIRE